MKKTTGPRGAEDIARQLRDVFGSRVDDDTIVPLGDIEYFRAQYTYSARSSVNFLLSIIFKLGDQIADLRQTLKSMQPREIDEPEKCKESARSSRDIVSHPSHYDTYIVKDINVNHPTHYNAHAKECIVEMYILFGLDKFITFCTMNAWKYRYRAGNKANNSADQDNAKADRYIEYARRAKEIDYWTLDPKRLTDDDFWSKYEA